MASGVTLLTTLLAAPLAFGAVEPWAWAGLCVLSGVSLVLWAMGCASTGRMQLVLSPMHVVFVLALTLVAGQLVLGKTVDPIGTREALIKLVGYFTIFFLAGQLSAELSIRAWRWFGIAIITYVFALSLFAIVQFFSNTQLMYWTVKLRWPGCIFGPYINHNHYAGLLEILLPLAIGALLALPENYAFKPLGAFAVLLALASVLVCGSRGGTIAIVTELAIFAIVISRAGGVHRTPILIAFAVAVFGLTLFTWIVPSSVIERWEKTTEAPEAAAQPRFLMSADAVQIFHHYPLAGIGTGAYRVASPKYQSWATELVVDHVHNDYAELLAETGAAGGILLIAFSGLFFVQIFRNLRHCLVGADNWMCISSSIACCGILIHSFTDFNLHIPANAAWFSVAVAGGFSIAGINRHA
jgi:O-antigen ligase